MAERHEKAPPQRFRCRPVHVVTSSRERSATEVLQLYYGSSQKIRATIFKPEQRGPKSRARKPLTLLKARLTSRGNAPALMSACNTADQSMNCAQRSRPHAHFCCAASKMRLCLRGVNRVVLTVVGPLPVHLHLRTCRCIALNDAKDPAPHRRPYRAEELIALRRAGRRSPCMRHHPLGLASD